VYVAILAIAEPVTHGSIPVIRYLYRLVASGLLKGGGEMKKLIPNWLIDEWWGRLIALFAGIIFVIIAIKVNGWGAIIDVISVYVAMVYIRIIESKVVL
jgi:hypothetical protein